MAGRGPTLINLPPPPSDPATPSELGPGTPNSGNTSLSTLSVVAIKDGATGHGGRGNAPSLNTLEAERNDRISRLAGLERVGTLRAGHGGQMTSGTGTQPGPSYFDNIPQVKERSTVGSASATASIGGNTTWASESVDYDADKMSEDPDDGVSSVGGFSDEDKASLVGFGEGAGSTVSGPVSTPNARMTAARQNLAYATRQPPPLSYSGQSTPMSGIVQTSTAGSTDPKMMDGMSYDANVVVTAMQPAQPVGQNPHSRYSGQGTELAETIMRDRVADADPTQRAMGTPDSSNLGRFSFEKDQ